jgi:hypothetical protein
LRLELEEKAPKRLLEPSEGGLRSLGSPAERGLPATWGARVGLAARPAIEKVAERDRGYLTRGQRADEPPRCRI